MGGSATVVALLPIERNSRGLGAPGPGQKIERSLLWRISSVSDPLSIAANALTLANAQSNVQAGPYRFEHQTSDFTHAINALCPVGNVDRLLRCDFRDFPPFPDCPTARVAFPILHLLQILFPALIRIRDLYRFSNLLCMYIQLIQPHTPLPTVSQTSPYIG